MKNFKIFLFLVCVSMFTSCEEGTWESSDIKNPLSVTTLEMQHSIVDSCAILAYYNNAVFMLDTNMVATKKFTSTGKDTINTTTGVFITCFLLTFFIGLILGLMNE